ncbi:MAG TPA: hypothetical protein VG265_14215 [Gaiellaceae bacterium]|jgi:hypothetical protein|nr:hypothetical protein [Gaiellaceae bacterium]
MKPIYVRTGKVIDDIREVARAHGYAIAVHGSLRAERDIDLVAVPWTEKAHAYSTLIRAVGNLAYLQRPKGDDDHQKPHGRVAAMFTVKYRARGCPAYVDLSVMPRNT